MREVSDVAVSTVMAEHYLVQIGQIHNLLNFVNDQPSSEGQDFRFKTITEQTGWAGVPHPPARML
jgi:hypothetical protein